MKRSGRLRIIAETTKDSRGKDRWRCICDCGTRTVVYGFLLRSKKRPTRSCGCLQRERSRQFGNSYRLTHGEAKRESRTAEYRSWTGMIGRCENSRDAAFKDYGARGITVCARWRRSYKHFLADMGRKPTPKHSLDRINNDGSYTPTNCRWATQSEQRRNRRDAT